MLRNLKKICAPEKSILLKFFTILNKNYIYYNIKNKNFKAYID